MRIVCVGGGPGGLYLAILMKQRDPGHDITVLERNPAGYYRLRRMTELLPLFDRLWQWASSRGRARYVRRAPTA